MKVKITILRDKKYKLTKLNFDLKFHSDVWKWLDLTAWCPLFLPPRELARIGTTSSTVVSNEQ